MDFIEQIIAEEKCTGCQACLNICPCNAITMKEREDTFLYPEINQSSCTNCKACEKVCPAISENLFDRIASPICYASWQNDDKIRIDSSSGGIFSALAKKIIENNGYVYGAAFDENLKLNHVECNTIDKLQELRGSKYLQSNIGTVFSQIKKRIKEGQWVLFVGAPCQVAGLNTFIGKDHATLITCDFVCHGVPSGKIFNKYVQELEKKNESRITSYYFRRKKFGWKDFNIEINYDNGQKEEIPFIEDSFMKGFIADLYLRPSCYNCSASRIPRVADISLADYWQVWDFMPDICDQRGVSAVLINSEKGIKIYSELTNIKSITTNLDWIVKGNPSLNSSVKKPRKRKLFYSLYRDNISFQQIIEKCLPPPTYLDKIKWSLNRRIKKIFYS